MFFMEIRKSVGIIVRGSRFRRLKSTAFSSFNFKERTASDTEPPIKYFACMYKLKKTTQIFRNFNLY